MENPATAQICSWTERVSPSYNAISTLVSQTVRCTIAEHGGLRSDFASRRHCAAA